MRKILGIACLVLLLAVPAFGATVETKVSGSTVAFSSSLQTVVTFNSVTRKIIIFNESLDSDLYVDLVCVNGLGIKGEMTATSATVKVPYSTSPNSVAFDFSTRNLGFTTQSGVAGTNGAGGNVTYIVFGDQGDL